MPCSMRRMMTAALVAAVVLCAATLSAATVNTGGVEAAARAVGFDRGDTESLARLFRGAVNAGLPAARLESLVRQALEAEMEPEQVERILVLLTTTALDDLPASTVMNKFGEGLAKEIDARHLVEAVENRALALKRARKILSALVYGNQPLGGKELVLVTVAGALERGGDEREIETILGQEGRDLKSLLVEIERLH